MIKSILFLIFTFFSLPAISTVVSDNGIEDLLNERSSDSLENIKYKGCDDLQINGLERSLLALKSNLTTLQQEVRDYKTDELTNKEKKFVRNVGKKLECIQKKLENKLTFRCVDPNTCGDMVMFIKDFPLLPRALQKNQINSCISNLYYTENFTAGVILHELSHLCGTSDHEYLLDQRENNLTPQLSYDFKLIRSESGVEVKDKTFSSRGHLNADSYRYWYILGFCVPGKDCRV